MDNKDFLHATIRDPHLVTAPLRTHNVSIFPMETCLVHALLIAGLSNKCDAISYFKVLEKPANTDFPTLPIVLLELVPGFAAHAANTCDHKLKMGTLL